MEFISNIIFSNNIIKFCRPMLSINKLQIYEYAFINNIPFLSDSTPNWSQRGQIRDLVKPCLESWNSNSINGLSELSIVMKESMECVDLLVDLWITKLSDTINPKDCVSEISKLLKTNIQLIKIGLNELTCNKIFWNRLLTKLKYTIKSGMLNEIQRKVVHIKRKFDLNDFNQVQQIQISKDHGIYYWKSIDKKLILAFV